MRNSEPSRLCFPVYVFPFMFSPMRNSEPSRLCFPEPSRLCFPFMFSRLCLPSRLYLPNRTFSSYLRAKQRFYIPAALSGGDTGRFTGRTSVR